MRLAPGTKLGDFEVLEPVESHPSTSYTVFARVEGMENLDRILEGDVMTSVKILRR